MLPNAAGWLGISAVPSKEDEYHRGRINLMRACVGPLCLGYSSGSYTLGVVLYETQARYPAVQMFCLACLIAVGAVYVAIRVAVLDAQTGAEGADKSRVFCQWGFLFQAVYVLCVVVSWLFCDEETAQSALERGVPSVSLFVGLIGISALFQRAMFGLVSLDVLMLHAPSVFFLLIGCLRRYDRADIAGTYINWAWSLPQLLYLSSVLSLVVLGLKCVAAGKGLPAADAFAPRRRSPAAQAAILVNASSGPVQETELPAPVPVRAVGASVPPQCYIVSDSTDLPSTLSRSSDSEDETPVPVFADEQDSIEGYVMDVVEDQLEFRSRSPDFAQGGFLNRGTEARPSSVGKLMSPRG
jgi:hypothetical protein